MAQLNLDFSPAHTRREHPIQSHQAACRKTDSRTLPKDRLAVLKAVAKRQGFTAKQLDAMYHLDGKCHRRAAELDKAGFIWRDKSGPEMRCYLTEKGKNFIINQD